MIFKGDFTKSVKSITNIVINNNSLCLFYTFAFSYRKRMAANLRIDFCGCNSQIRRD